MVEERNSGPAADDDRINEGATFPDVADYLAGDHVDTRFTAIAFQKQCDARTINKQWGVKGCTVEPAKSEKCRERARGASLW
eukprot:gene12167-biopygen550